MGVTVREKYPGEFWVFMAHKGRRRSKKVGRDERKAIEVAKKLEARIALGDLGFMEEKKQGLNFETYAETWIEGFVKTALKASTYRGYRSILDKHLLPAFGKLPIDGITRDEIKAFLVELSAGEITISRVRRIKAALSGVFSNAMEDGRVTTNPAARLDKWLKPKDQALDKEISPYTAQELEVFLKAVQTHYAAYYPFFLTLARTGCRLGEALGLQFGDIDFNGGFIEIRRALVDGKETTTKTGKARRVNATPQLLTVLAELHRRRKAETLKRGWKEVPPWAFVNADGKPLDARNVRQRIHYKACEKAKLRRIRIHDLRHSYATIRINAGHNIADVSKQLGHKSIKITVDTYYKWIEGAQSSQVAELDELGRAAPGCTLSASGKKKRAKREA